MKTGGKKQAMTIGDWVLFYPYTTPLSGSRLVLKIRDRRTGKTYTKTSDTTAIQDAVLAGHSFVAEMEEKIYRNASMRDVQFGEKIEEFLTEKRMLGIADASINAYGFALRVAMERFKEISFNAVAFAKIAQTFNELRCFDRDGNPTSTPMMLSTKQKYLVQVSAYFDWAKDKGYIKENPIGGQKKNLIVNPRRVAEEKRIPVSLTENQFRELLTASLEPTIISVSGGVYERAVDAPEYLRLMLLIGFYTGIRPENIINLRYSQVIPPKDGNLGRIEIARKEMKMKTNRADFSIPIHPTLWKVIQEQMAKLDGVHPDYFVISNSTHKITNYIHSWNPLLRKSGIKVFHKGKELPIRFYDATRKTFETMLAGKEVSPVVMCLLMDHRMDFGEAETYIDGRGEGLEKAKEDAIRQLPDVLSPVASTKERGASLTG